MQHLIQKLLHTAGTAACEDFTVFCTTEYHLMGKNKRVPSKSWWDQTMQTISSATCIYVRCRLLYARYRFFTSLLHHLIQADPEKWFIYEEVWSTEKRVQSDCQVQQHSGYSVCMTAAWIVPSNGSLGARETFWFITGTDALVLYTFAHLYVCILSLLLLSSSWSS